jgi:hypothetical protein
MHGRKCGVQVSSSMCLMVMLHMSSLQVAHMGMDGGARGCTSRSLATRSLADGMATRPVYSIVAPRLRPYDPDGKLLPRARARSRAHTGARHDTLACSPRWPTSPRSCPRPHGRPDQELQWHGRDCCPIASSLFTLNTRSGNVRSELNYCGRVLRWLTKRRLEQQGKKQLLLVHVGVASSHEGGGGRDHVRPLRQGHGGQSVMMKTVKNLIPMGNERSPGNQKR